MKQKIFILILGYFTLGIISFSSCERLLKYDATICDIQFSGINTADFSQNGEPDTFDEKIGFRIQAIESSPTCYHPSFQVFSSAFATTKCAEYQNQLLQSTFQLYLDRHIIFNGDSLPSNTDLLNISEIRSMTNIEINVECSFVSSTIIFKPELLNQVEFETGEYEVTFKCSTSDSRHFTKTRRVIFEE